MRRRAAVPSPGLFGMDWADRVPLSRKSGIRASGPTDLPPCSNDNLVGKRLTDLGLTANGREASPDYSLFRRQRNLERVQNAALMLIGLGKARDGSLVINIVDEQ